MASAAAYNLLIINDIEQDKLLFNTAKLKETIAIAKYNNAKKLDNEINELTEQIDFLDKNAVTTVDTRKNGFIFPLNKPRRKI